MTVYFIHITQENANPQMEAQELPYPGPVLLVRGSIQAHKDIYLVCNRSCLCKVSLANIPLILFACFYVFHLQYSEGCTTFFSFFDSFFLDHKVVRRPRLTHLLTRLNC